MLCHQAKKLPEAEQAGRRAIEIQNALAADRPDDVEVRTWAGAYLNNLADTLMDAGQFAEARQLLEQAIVHQRAALKIDPAHAQSQDFLNIHLVLLTEVHVLLGDDEAAAKMAARAWRSRAVSGRRCDRSQLSHKSVKRGSSRRRSACTMRNSPQRQESGAKAHFLVAKALIREAVQRAPDDPNQYMIADLLTTAPEPLRDPDLASEIGPAGCGAQARERHVPCNRWAGRCTGRAISKVLSRPSRSTSDGGENDFVLAMAHWQLGEKKEAQAHFDGANEWLKGYEQRCEEALKQGTFTFPLPVQLKRLQAEAAALLGVTPPTVEPAPEPAAKVEEAQELPKSTPAPEAAKEEEKPQ